MYAELEQYWECITRNDERALEKLYKKVFPDLVRYAISIIPDSNLAEEAVQDVLLKLWQNRSSIIIHDSFKSFLFRTVHNHVLNIIRHRNTLRQSVNRQCSEEMWRFIADNYDLDEQITEQLVADETDKLILRTVEALPEQCQKVFSMSRYESMSNEEIAQRLGLSEHTIRTHIYRALRKIAEVLGKSI